MTNYYIYGLGLLYEVTETATTTNTLTYHYDFRGSTIALTDGNGNVTDRVEYSPYATTTYRSGTNDTPFLFNGRYGVQTDANGLLHMRARYYNPYLCRFLNADPSGFSGGLNFYAYADGNPISLIDPFGLGADEAGGGSYWLGVGQVFQGYGNAIGGLVGGIASAVAHPINTVAGLGNAVAHPINTAGAIWNGVGQTFTDLGSTDPRVSGQAMGNILLTAATVAAPYARAGQVAEVANVAGNATGFLGSQGFELGNLQGVRNTPGVIGGRNFSAHAFDQMQNRGIMPSVVENTIGQGVQFPGRTAAEVGFYDSVNNVQVIVNSQNGNVITTTFGKPTILK